MFWNEFPVLDLWLIPAPKIQIWFIFIRAYYVILCALAICRSLLHFWSYSPCRFYLFIYLYRFVFAFRLSNCYSAILSLFGSFAHSLTLRCFFFFFILSYSSIYYYYSGFLCAICIWFLSDLMIAVCMSYFQLLLVAFFSLFFLVCKAEIQKKKKKIIHSVFNLCKLVIRYQHITWQFWK